MWVIVISQTYFSSNNIQDNIERYTEDQGRTKRKEIGAWIGT